MQIVKTDRQETIDWKKEKEDIWDVELENCLHKEKYIMIQSSRHVLRPARREIPCNIGI